MFVRMAEAAEAGTASPIGFEEILRDHQSMVFSIAYHFLRDRAAAEELAQDVFLQLYRSIDSLESTEHATRWLRRVTTNRCIDFCRRRKLAPQISLEEVREPATPAAARDPMLSRALGQLVASLPEKWRALIVLKYQEEMDNEEIAETLEIPVGTVKSQLSRALDLLREKASRVLGEMQ
jgi:RNA polymerase sigma-70 factor (ECF subfamily)